MNLIYTITTILDLLALVVQFVGSLVMYLNSPLNRPEGVIFGAGDTIIPKQRNRRLKTGFSILALGLFIALVSKILSMFYPALNYAD
jgi:hypothetical protein